MAKTLSNFVITKSSVLGFYSSARAKEANAKLEGSVLVTSEKELAEVSGPRLVEIHNDFVAPFGDQVKKFRDKSTAAARVWLLLPEAAVIPEAETTAHDGETPKETPKPKKAPKTSAPEKKSSGKKAQWTGKKAHRTKAGLAAKRREDTSRTASWNVIQDGMTYEECLKKGAKAPDLDKIFRMGHVVWK